MHPHAPAPPETSLPRLPPLAWPGPAQAARAPRADMTIWVFDKGLEYRTNIFLIFFEDAMTSFALDVQFVPSRGLWAFRTSRNRKLYVCQGRGVEKQWNTLWHFARSLHDTQP